MDDFKQGRARLSSVQAANLRKRLQQQRKVMTGQHVEPAPKSVPIRRRKKHIISAMKQQPKLTASLIIGTALLISGGMWLLSERPATTGDQLGVQSEGEAGQASDLPVIRSEDELAVDLLLPSGKRMTDYQVVRISPEANDPVYAFIDSINEAPIRISQQAIPARFEGRQQDELQALAKEFQATNVIQIDDNRIYHGYNERQRVQSLIFIKNQNLVFISSSKKHSDDIWAGYINALK